MPTPMRLTRERHVLKNVRRIYRFRKQLAAIADEQLDELDALTSSVVVKLEQAAKVSR